MNVREYRKGNQKFTVTIQRRWQDRVHKYKEKQSRNRTQYDCAEHDNAQTNTNNVNKT
jgi:hypothetical protein